MHAIAVAAHHARLDDAAALRRYASRGDADAFLVLVTRYQGMVLATCRRALSDPADAEDATQETFLKLAQQAQTVRTNVAAWLHRCATGTSIDLARRTSAIRRADARGARPAGASTAGATGANLEWSDLEPLIDRALGELRDDDRDLVVARYLAGRSQAELAREAGVSESTLSRRLNKAVGRLRASLGASGLSITSAAVLIGALDAVAAAPVPASVSAGLGKIAVAAVGTPTKGIGGTGVAVIASGIVLTGAMVLTPMLLRAGSGSAAGVAVSGRLQPEAALGPPRPRGTIGPFEVVTASDRSFQERGIWIAQNSMSVRYGYTQDGEARIATLDVLRITETPDGPDTREFQERAVLEARVSSITPLNDSYSRFGVGQRLSIRYSTDAYGRIVLEEESGKVQLGRNEPRWYGVRPPIGWPEYGRIPDDDGEFDLWGPWTEAERIPVTITEREINFGTTGWSAARYRIIAWERVEGWSRVLSIQAGGRDPRLIGTRFRLLLREDDDGYTIAYYPPGSPLGDTWPPSFEPSASNPVIIVSFLEQK